MPIAYVLYLPVNSSLNSGSTASSIPGDMQQIPPVVVHQRVHSTSLPRFYFSSTIFTHCNIRAAKTNICALRTPAVFSYP
ncbi:hypothetical protein O6P43_004676 [Quillaja saponaria]|uniref:Uncharacterized protein n=1 Tax=Quillaja saponaria TaxID=32244 RepID=A0AAD7VGE2_QUISA|nr:hypothetical protein O6P43_004676 [Quillaja saponaria]